MPARPVATITLTVISGTLGVCHHKRDEPNLSNHYRLNKQSDSCQVNHGYEGRQKTANGTLLKMNTHGHAEVAKEAGLPLLNDAFPGLASLEALHLGNWLTDVSQAVDPVAYASVASKGRSAVDAIDQFRKTIESAVEEALGAMLEHTPAVLAGPAQRELIRVRELLGKRADEVKKVVLNSIDDVFAGKDQERDSQLGQFFRSIFLVIGYFKFVHPESAGKPPRMDFECYMRVFGRPNDTRGGAGSNPALDRPGAYTQYYPHEHLDRPELIPPQDPPIYSPGRQTGSDNTLSAGASPGTRAKNDRRPFRPDLYSYLRDHMEMTAGLLCEVDRDMRAILGRMGLKPPFAGNPRLATLDHDPEWHICLAKLGHALHQVEDFFAHSNWVELVVDRGGAAAYDKYLPRRAPADLLNRARTVVEKRLRRHLTSPEKNWTSHPPEKWVVTGYFDFNDTILSLLHLTEEAWGGEVPDPWAELDEAGKKLQELREKPSEAVAAAQRLLRQSFDLLTDPRAAQADPDNDVAKLYHERFGHDIDRLRRPKVQEDLAKRIASEAPLLAKAPPEIRDTFFRALVLGSQASGARDLYKSIKTISEFVVNPAGWLLRQLPEKLKDAVVFYTRERVYDFVAMDRLGCHSLMAKDHGLKPLYEPNKQCATAVHYFTVKTLLRFREDGAPADIDWLRFLEFFLRNPAAQNTASRQLVKASVSILYEVQKDDQLDSPIERYSLTKRFRRTAANPETFTWRTIADANFNTKGLSDEKAREVINQTLRDHGWGYPVKPPNYAFKTGVRLWIPDQLVRRQALVARSTEPNWFEVVMDKGWRIFRDKSDPNTPLKPYIPSAISKDEFKTIISRGRQLRMLARQQYRPAPNQ